MIDGKFIIKVVKPIIGLFQNKLKFTFNPMEFKLPMANDLVLFINPYLVELKHPLTVKVS